MKCLTFGHTLIPALSISCQPVSYFQITQQLVKIFIYFSGHFNTDKSQHNGTITLTSNGSSLLHNRNILTAYRPHITLTLYSIEKLEI